MLFNSFPFLLFLAVTFGLFYVPILRQWQTHILILASLFFYAYNQPLLVFLLLTSILINAGTSFKVLSASQAHEKKAWATVGVVLNLLVLFFFKYGPLAARSLKLDGADPGSIGYALLHVPLPIGISFFTFQGISLLVDVYRQKENAPQSIAHQNVYHHFLDTAFFKAFFPQLVAGPIVKAHDFYPQIGPKYFAAINWERAFRAIVIGYFLKMVIADNLKDLTYWIAYPHFLEFSTITLLAMLFGYSMQIFADFAGYSLIAIGVARLFGYELMENFNFPYISQSLSEFWRRWHISLSTWLREYLYFPLGGNRRGEMRTYLNLMIVMVLGGLWHGAAWSYAVWGSFHGIGLAIERWAQSGKAPDPLRPPSFWRMSWVFSFVTLGWLLFKLPHFQDVISFFNACLTNWRQSTDTRLIAFVGFYSIPVIAYHFLALRKSRSGYSLSPVAQQLGYAGCLLALLVNSGSPGAFIYFQF